MQIEYAPGKRVTLTQADQFVLDFMLGIVNQGHGHHRVRAAVPAIKYLRMQYDLDLVEARDAVLAYEKQEFCDDVPA